jgi:hypothetical protein
MPSGGRMKGKPPPAGEGRSTVTWCAPLNQASLCCLTANLTDMAHLPVCHVAQEPAEQLLSPLRLEPADDGRSSQGLVDQAIGS